MERILSSKCVDQVGKQVQVAGWVASIRDHGQLVFIDMRDWEGVVQLVVYPDQKEAFETAKSLGNEFVIEAFGNVVERDATLVNEKLATGKIEIMVEELTILNRSKSIPFPLDTDGNEVDENLRLKYRFIDMRRERIKTIMKKKHDFLISVRNWFDKNDFTEVITPLLTSTSPEGARDFYIPSRIHKGKFFVLPQAPQQYKQLLMVGGVDRYFQIAPCARDEDPRADRHAGVFYQIDVEISFPDIDTIFGVCEGMIKDTYSVVAPDKELSESNFLRIPYKECLERFGTDKPDARFGMELMEITDYAGKLTDFKIFSGADTVKCIVASNCGGWSRKDIEAIEEFAKSNGAKGLAYTKVEKDGFSSGIAKFIEPIKDEILVASKANEGDLIFFMADERKLVNKVLGMVRNRLGDELGLKDKDELAFVWITDFPFYEKNDETGKLEFGHNPFSMPKGGMEAFKTDDPLSIETYQYDLSLNGYEILSGSIRNHDPEVLVKAFEVVGYGRDEVIKRFGGMFNAFHYGAPPHGGFAVGFDRLFMVLIDEPNIRDTYAFPKNSNGMDVMMDAPSEAPEEDLQVLGIEHTDKSDKVFKEIIKLLEANKVRHELMEHEPVRTSEEAAKVRGTKLGDAAKAMVLASKEYENKLYMVVIPADRQLDLIKAEGIIGESLRVASAEEVESYTGLQVGGIPPFGRLLKMDLFYDSALFTKESSVFNCGRKDRSVMMDTSDLIKLAQPDKRSKELDFLV
jgi:aspartyl-tRNA synthetase